MKTIKFTADNSSFKKIAYWVLMLTIFLTYWLFSRQYTGPAYLSDEVGYLTKAAAFAGYSVDLANHWHGGYSLVISPLFMFFSDPFSIWQALMALNAAIWTFSFMLLFRLLKEFFPDRGFWEIFFAVAISSVYPAWISMSGYAFANTLFVFVFLLSILALLRSSLDSARSIIPHALLVGFLYWIHPAGTLIAGSSLLVLAGYSWYYGRYKIILFYLVTIILVIGVYKFAVHTWLDQVMTPKNYKSLSHYEGVSLVARSSFDPRFWSAWLIMIWGHFSSLLISTFGIILYALVEIWNRIRLPKTDIGEVSVPNYTNIVMFFIVVSFFAILLGSSVAFARLIDMQVYTDYWIYARYLEMILLPLLAIGLMAFWRLKYALTASFIILITGLMLHLYTNESNTDDYNNLLNIQSFWPQALFPHESYLYWFMAGIAGIILAALLKKRLFVFLALPLWFISISNHSNWHQYILTDYSKPSGIVNLIPSYFHPAQCIGFDPEETNDSVLFQRERRRLYSYYFYNYDFRRMSPEEWLSGCNGPYLTYRPEIFSKSSEAKVVAKAAKSHLFLVLKTKKLDELSRKPPSLPITGLQVDLTGDAECLIKGCFSMNASALIKFSRIGIYRNGKIASSGQSGYLFYGPYYPLKKGKYTIELKGEFADPKGALLDIVSEMGKSEHLKVSLSDQDSKLKTISFPFILTSDVPNIEIRLRVGPDTNITIDGYSIKLQN